MNKKKKLLIYNALMGGASEPAYDADASAYFTRITSAGGTISIPEKIAANTFVLQLKTDGLWSKNLDLGIFLGGFAGSLVKLKTLNPSFYSLLNDGSTPLVAGDYGLATGITVTASGKRLNTQIIPATYSLTNVNFYASVGVLDNYDAVGGRIMGDNPAAGKQQFHLSKTQIGFSDTDQARTVVDKGLGLNYSHSIITDTNNFYPVEDFMVDYPAVPNVAPVAVTFASTVSLFTTRNNGSNASVNASVGFYVMGDKLTYTEHSLLQKALRTLLTSLGRIPSTEDVVTSGDSVTFGSLSTSYANRWSRIVATSLGLKERNNGISGSRYRNTYAFTPGGYDRRAEALNYRVYSGGKVILMYGINDMNQDLTTNGDPNITLEFTAKMVKQVNEEVAAGVPLSSIIVCTQSLINTGANSTKQDLYAEANKDVARITGCLFVDVLNYMRNNGGASLLSGDNAHPTDAGHAVIATAVLTTAATVSGEVSPTTRLIAVGTGLGYTMPNATLQGKINTLIVAGLTQQVLHKHDQFKMFRLNDAGLSNFSTLDYINPSANQAVLVSSPTYGTGGFTMNGTSNYIRSGFIPRNGVKFTDSDGFASAKQTQTAAAATFGSLFGVNDNSGGAARLLMRPRDSTNTRAYFINSGAGDSGASTDASGRSTVIRSSSTATRALRNGVQVDSAVAGGSNRPNIEVYIGANNELGTANWFAPITAEYFEAGGDVWSDADDLAMHTIIESFIASL